MMRMNKTEFKKYCTDYAYLYVIKLTSEKLDRLLKMKARTDGNGHSRLITELEEKE